MASRHPHADLPVDDSVIIPAAILKAGADADALHQQIFGQPEAPQPQPGDPPPLPPEAPPAPVPPPPPQQQAAPEAPPAPPPTPAPNPNEPIVEPPPAQQGSEEGKWERAYKSMKGRHDHLKANTDRMTAGLNQRISELEREMATTRAAPPAPQMPTPNAPGGLPEGITEEDLNNWGPDMIAMIDRVADARAKKVTGTVREEFEQVRGTVQQTARDRLLGFMDTAFPPLSGETSPHWRAVNTDQNFLAWLNLRDDLSGRIRGELLNDAFTANDGPRVAAFFRSFISEASPAPAAASTNTVQPPAPQAPPSNRMSMASLAAPGGARTAATPPASPAEKRNWKTSDIGAFYAAVNRGAYNGREAEMNALEQDIFVAQSEGRVTEG